MIHSLNNKGGRKKKKGESGLDGWRQLMKSVPPPPTAAEAATHNYYAGGQMERGGGSRSRQTVQPICSFPDHNTVVLTICEEILLNTCLNIKDLQR